jgi:hypothetical protein
MESKKFNLNIEDIKKILIGACIAMGGAFCTYLLQLLPNVDFGQFTPMVVAILSILVNALRKFIEGR